MVNREEYESDVKTEILTTPQEARRLANKLIEEADRLEEASGADKEISVEYVDCEHYSEINKTELFKQEDIINIETRPDPDRQPHNYYRVWYRELK